MANSRKMTDRVFRCSSGTNTSAHKNDLQTFNILLALDGKRTVGTIAREDFYDPDVLTAKLEEMLALGLIEPAIGPTGSLDPTFFDQLTDELTLLVGPVAGMLVKDTADTMGHTTANFPSGKIELLLSEIARFIQGEAKAADFQHRMRVLAEKKR